MCWKVRDKNTRLAGPHSSQPAASSEYGGIVKCQSNCGLLFQVKALGGGQVLLLYGLSGGGEETTALHEYYGGGGCEFQPTNYNYISY